MNIKNYTSSVPVERSIMLIEKMLNDAGALSIIKHNNPISKEPEAMIFSIHMPGIQKKIKHFLKM